MLHEWRMAVKTSTTTKKERGTFRVRNVKMNVRFNNATSSVIFVIIAVSVATVSQESTK